MRVAQATLHPGAWVERKAQQAYKGTAGIEGFSFHCKTGGRDM